MHLKKRILSLECEVNEMTNVMVGRMFANHIPYKLDPCSTLFQCFTVVTAYIAKHSFTCDDSYYQPQQLHG